jgi:hypothetical protein
VTDKVVSVQFTPKRIFINVSSTLHIMQSIIQETLVLAGTDFLGMVSEVRGFQDGQQLA